MSTTDAASTPLLIDHEPPLGDLLAEAVAGLAAPRKRLPCTLLWDDAGSRLFDAICATRDYYPFRSELALLREHLPEIARRAGPGRTVVEFGAGCGLKTRMLLEALAEPAACVAIDIARGPLLAACAALARDFPATPVVAVRADYAAPIALPPLGGRRLGFFPGSTIGNFTPAQAVRFLTALRGTLGDDGALLIGVDHTGDPARLERAYDDTEGVTAAFNRNLLTRLRRETGAEVDPDGFDHRAVFRSWHRRIEMQLVSRGAQSIAVGGRSFALADGEAITTEYAYKHRPTAFRALAGAAGWRVATSWVSRTSGCALHWLDP